MIILVSTDAKKVMFRYDFDANKIWHVRTYDKKSARTVKR